MYNHNKAQQSKNRVHISWDILYSWLNFPSKSLQMGCDFAPECQTKIWYDQFPVGYFIKEAKLRLVKLPLKIAV